MATQDVDAQLVVLAGAGDEAALTALYRTHAAAALQAARVVTGNDHDAEDARSDAFVRLLYALRAGRVPSDRFRPYLLTASRRAAIDVLRHSARVRPCQHLDVLDRPTDGDAPGERLVRAVDTELVKQAFHALPLRWQNALLLIDVDRRSLSDAGTILGLSSNGAAQLAVRARAGLRRLLVEPVTPPEQLGGAVRARVAR